MSGETESLHMGIEGGYSMTSGRLPTRDMIFISEQVDIKTIPKVSDSVWRRHNEMGVTMGSTNLMSNTTYDREETEAVESWRQLAEFDNRVSNVNQPSFKYPKIEYNRMFNTKTANSN